MTRKKKAFYPMNETLPWSHHYYHIINNHKQVINPIIKRESCIFISYRHTVMYTIRNNYEQ